jgi:uncharacterized membrane protein
LPIRLDYEACLAYLLLPPAGGVLLLVLEQKSDYVRSVSPRAKSEVGLGNDPDGYRFHAWQSSLLFSAIFVLHLIFSWSSFISWTFLLCDVVLIGYLTMRAYRDGKFGKVTVEIWANCLLQADTLDRCEMPFFGRLASRILDDE